MPVDRADSGTHRQRRRLTAAALFAPRYDGRIPRLRVVNAALPIKG
ncbi:MAG: hypothetical protein ACUVX1_00155 [Chloroflexota bacterium]